MTLRTATFYLLLDEGAGGGALALVPADRVVAECQDAADETREFLGRLGSVLQYEPISLLHHEPAERMCTRYRRCRGLGLP